MALKWSSVNSCIRPFQPIIYPPVPGMSSGSSIHTRIITSIAAIAQSPASVITMATISMATAPMATVSTATVATSSAMQLTAHQQTLLARVEGQIKALASNTARTAEQERFLQLLTNAQRQIHAQGRCQLQAALTGGSAAGKTSSTTTVNSVSVTSTPSKTTAGRYCLSSIVLDVVQPIVCCCLICYTTH